MIKTLCIILNWNNPLDTIQVADEVISNQNASVVIVDNNSGDNSLIEIKSFFSGTYSGINWQDEQELSLVPGDFGKPKLYLVSMPSNYGFAKAINRIILQIPEGQFEYVWLLNNDAFPDKNALKTLESALENHRSIGFAGSVIADFTERNKIQCCGVKYYPFLGISKLVLKNNLLSGINPASISKERIDFQHGASLLVRLDMLKKTGMMDERFFLYFEEQDWQTRAKNSGFENRLVLESIVFHKGSMSTEHSKHLFFYYYNCSAIIYSLKHNNFFQILLSFIGIFLISLKRTRFNIKSLSWGIKGMVNGVKKYRHR